MISIILLSIILSYILCRTNIRNNDLKSLLQDPSNDLSDCTTDQVAKFQTWVAPSDTFKPFSQETPEKNILRYIKSNYMIFATYTKTDEVIKISKIDVYSPVTITPKPALNEVGVANIQLVSGTYSYHLEIDESGNVIEDRSIYYNYYEIAGTPYDIEMVMIGEDDTIKGYSIACTTTTYIDDTAVLTSATKYLGHDYAVKTILIEDRRTITLDELLNKRFNTNGNAYTSYRYTDKKLCLISYDGINQYTLTHYLFTNTPVIIEKPNKIYLLPESSSSSIVVTCGTAGSDELIDRTCTKDASITPNENHFINYIKYQDGKIYLYKKYTLSGDSVAIISNFMADYSAIKLLVDEGWGDCVDDVTTQSTTTEKPTTTTEKPTTTTEEPTTTTKEPTTSTGTGSDTDTDMTEETNSTVSTTPDNINIITFNVILIILLSFVFFI